MTRSTRLLAVGVTVLVAALVVMLVALRDQGDLPSDLVTARTPVPLATAELASELGVTALQVGVDAQTDVLGPFLDAATPILDDVDERVVGPLLTGPVSASAEVGVGGDRR